MQAHDKKDVASFTTKPKPISSWLITGVVIAILVALSAVLWLNLNSGIGAAKPEEKADAEEKPVEITSVDLEPESEANISTLRVALKPAMNSLLVSGVIEANQQQLQQITPLVSGRVETVNAALGDYVKAGSVVIVITSPQVAELHGKLHEAETRLRLAQENLGRVQNGSNRVAILKGKATLDEASSNLERTKQLVKEGLSPRKDLISTESEYERAKAEFNYQSNISLNREVAVARGELETARTEAEHIKDGLQALDASLTNNEALLKRHDISLIQLKAPISGTVIERFVNPGAGFEQGKPLLTIANTSSLWVIANVPEQQVPKIRLGMPAELIFDENHIAGRVTYIDSRLNEDTRTARVRIEVDNRREALKVGMFAQVKFDINSVGQMQLLVPSESVQNLNTRTVVFVPDAEKRGHYLIKDIKVSEEKGGFIPVLSGLAAGDIVVGKGAFVLKSKALKGQFGEDE
ncbi:efflux RND transporter periplasmic adaptor subunit [bacterium]|nr:efflux RND transporter periplasmic adaptor subunit [bacterium]MBP9089541.1 efflux RND transporter periplasmic adaptor subunit [bacterium]MBP9808949.1 efflux RND transporter periplasmic adaptor subunit [bacterium]